MSRNRSVALCATLLTMAAGAAVPVQAADRGFCRDYAHAALNQVHGAMSHGRCRRDVDLSQTRWSTDYHVHFDWCRGVSPDQANGERDARRNILDHCAR